MHHSSNSEDEVSLPDTGIHEEARHQVPTAFIELESGALGYSRHYSGGNQQNSDHFI